VKKVCFLSLLLLLGSTKDIFSSMIDVTTLAPGIRVEMRYATNNNFTGKVLYPVSSPCLLVESVAQRLARVQQSLEKEGLGLKVWDCYRPISIQRKLWEAVPDANYVANPATGSKHNRGASVDLTLVDRHGRELSMPTPFDDFNAKAHRNYTNLPADVLRNRETLASAMQAEGFVGIPKEWWHFDDPEWAKFPLRDEPLTSPALLTDLENPQLSFRLPASCRQLVVVQTPEWRATTGRLSLYERKNNNWVENASWDINVGKKGMLWGRGLNPVEKEVQPKQEGDLTTPAGVFKIGQAYIPKERDSRNRRTAEHPADRQWPVEFINASWRCVDDPNSRYYNRVLSETSIADKDWRSAELMFRKDHIYDVVVNIEHNFPDTQKKAGSCIFFHVWRRPGAPTEGCVSMAADDMNYLLDQLQPESDPHVVILPMAVYEALKTSWELPTKK
jgi:zinc D-Ala-D-Ala dipeptidase